MKEFISEDEWKQVIQLLGIEHAQAVRIGPRERVVPGLESGWLMEVDSYVPGSAPPPGPYAVATFYVPVMLPGDEARRQRRLAEGDRKIAELVHGKRVEHAFLPDESRLLENDYCAPRKTDDLTNTPADGGWCAPEEGKLNI